MPTGYAFPYSLFLQDALRDSTILYNVAPLEGSFKSTESIARGAEEENLPLEPVDIETEDALEEEEEEDDAPNDEEELEAPFPYRLPNLLLSHHRRMQVLSPPNPSDPPEPHTRLVIANLIPRTWHPSLRQHNLRTHPHANALSAPVAILAEPSVVKKRERKGEVRRGFHVLHLGPMRFAGARKAAGAGVGSLRAGEDEVRRKGGDGQKEKPVMRARWEKEETVRDVRTMSRLSKASQSRIARRQANQDSITGPPMTPISNTSRQASVSPSSGAKQKRLSKAVSIAEPSQCQSPVQDIITVIAPSDPAPMPSIATPDADLSASTPRLSSPNLSDPHLAPLHRQSSSMSRSPSVFGAPPPSARSTSIFASNRSPSIFAPRSPSVFAAGRVLSPTHDFYYHRKKSGRGRKMAPIHPEQLQTPPRRLQLQELDALLSTLANRNFNIPRKLLERAFLLPEDLPKAVVEANGKAVMGWGVLAVPTREKGAEVDDVPILSGSPVARRHIQRISIPHRARKPRGLIPMHKLAVIPATLHRDDSDPALHAHSARTNSWWTKQDVLKLKEDWDMKRRATVAELPSSSVKATHFNSYVTSRPSTADTSTMTTKKKKSPPEGDGKETLHGYFSRWFARGERGQSPGAEALFSNGGEKFGYHVAEELEG
ncbi:hypothetical protein HDU97_002437 [Phlyctochytrium planicorne]|nr:hypothetical protein HDU97_002437 [Phlyctochytrium planicorne]